MPKEAQELAAKQYGSAENYQEYLLEQMSMERARKTMAKLVEWYGGKENYMEAATHPLSAQVTAAYGKRFDAARTKLIEKKGTDVNTFEVKECVGEMEFVSGQFLRLKEMKGYMLETAKDYRENEELRKHIEETYGEGTSDYLADAIEAFYQN